MNALDKPGQEHYLYATTFQQTMTNVTAFETVTIDGVDYSIIKSSEVIDAESKTGIKSWRGYVVRDEQGRFYVTSSWYNVNAKTGNRSVMSWATPYYAEPKNIGRSNATTNEAQAYSEFDSMVTKEKDKRQAERPLPMLAQKFSERKKYLKFPVAVQRKYDGMRVLYDGTEAWSRGNKLVIPEVFEHLHFDTKGHIVDGELMLPGNVKVNKTMEAAKKYRKGLSDTLIYVVYDIVDAAMPFGDRFDLLKQIVETANNVNIQLADTIIVDNGAAIEQAHAEFTAEGFEGSIIRNYDGKYLIGKRSNDLQKHKDFVDEEFEIVDVIPAGGGSSSDVGKIVCKDNQSDELFESTLTGDHEYRAEILRNKSNYIGKFAKVKFRERSGKNAVPFHSNVLEIRETKEGGF
jgi:DNA ligase-1